VATSVRYNGPHDSATIPMPDGTEITCPRGSSVSVPDSLAPALYAEGWTAPDGSTPGYTPPGPGPVLEDVFLANGVLSKRAAGGGTTAVSVSGASSSFRGAWAASTAYKANELVIAPSSATAKIRGRLVSANADFTSGSSFSVSNWTVAEHDEAYAGAWSATTAYTAGQVVSYLGALYSANADFTSGASFNGANWTRLDAVSGISDVPGLQTALDAKLDDSQLGQASGVASLGADGKVPTSQLPSTTSGHAIADEGSALTQRATLDFQGPGVTVTDDSANGKTIVTVPGGGGSGSTWVPPRPTGLFKFGRRLYTDFASAARDANEWDVTGTNGVQEITVSGAPTGGTITLTITKLDGTTTTVTVNWNATAVQLQQALNAALGPGSFICSGGPFPASKIQVFFVGQFSAQTVTAMTTNGGTNLTGGTSPSSSVAVGGFTYTTDASDSSRSALTPVSTSGVPGAVFARQQFSDFDLRARIRVPASPHPSSALRLLGRFIDFANYDYAQKITDSGNNVSQIHRVVNGSDGTIRSGATSDTDTSGGNVRLIRWRARGPYHQFKSWVEGTAEPDWQFSVVENVAGAEPTAPDNRWIETGLNGFFGKVFATGWYLSELTITELVRTDENILPNGDLSETDSNGSAAIGNLAWWTPNTPQASGSTVEVVQIADRFGVTRNAFHLKRTADTSGDAGVSMNLYNLLRSRYAGNRQRNWPAFLAESYSALEISLWSLAGSNGGGTPISHVTAGSDFLGFAVVNYYNAEDGAGLNIGRSDYYSNLGPNTASGTGGIGSWPWTLNVIRMPIYQPWRVALHTLSFHLHDTDAVGDVWFHDIMIRPVA
jgi:hypothetical protein